MKKSRIIEIIQEEIQSVLNERPLSEMAKITDTELGDAIKKVIDANPDMEVKPLKKLIDTQSKTPGNDIYDLAMGDTIYDNQLNKFIALTRGERVLSKRGRKLGTPNAPADPNAPEKAPKEPKAPKAPKAKKTNTDDESTNVVSKLGKSINTPKGGEVSRKDVKTAIGKKYSKETDIEGEQLSDLQAQEKKKMVKAFMKDMRDQGTLGANNKPVDRKKYDAEWAKAKAEIAAKVKDIK